MKNFLNLKDIPVRDLKKILFASDYPLIIIKRCLSHYGDLTEDEKNHILSYNPISVFNL